MLVAQCNVVFFEDLDKIHFVNVRGPSKTEMHLIESNVELDAKNQKIEKLAAKHGLTFEQYREMIADMRDSILQLRDDERSGIDV